MAINQIQPIGSSSVGGLLFQALAASGAFSVSEATQTRLDQLQQFETSTATRLADLVELRSLLVDFNSAAASLRPAATKITELDVTAVDPDTNLVSLDLTDDAENLETGDKIVFDTAIGVAANADTTYWVNVDSSGGGIKSVSLHNSRSDALNDTTPVDLTTNAGAGATAKHVKPQPQTALKDLFDAYNDVIEFLDDKTSSGNSLANEATLSMLGSNMLEQMLQILDTAEISPALSTGSNRELTIDSDVLDGLVDDNAQSIADALEGSGNIADDIRQLAESYIARVDTLVHTINQQSPELTAEIQSLLNQTVQEQQDGFHNIGKIAGAISQTQLRIQFLSTLGE